MVNTDLAIVLFSLFSVFLNVTAPVPIANYESQITNHRKRLSVAVIPFDDRSSGGNERWLEKGISAQIAWDLGLSQSFRIVPRAQSHKLADGLRERLGRRDYSSIASDIAERLHVDLVIFGSFLRQADQFQIQARLFDDHAVSPLIEITGRWDELLRFEDEIAERLFSAKSISVTQEQRSRMALDPTGSTAAYEIFARAFMLWDSEENPRGNIADAGRLYEDAIRFDPTYKKAFNNLGVVCEHQGDFDEARKNYAEAIRLGPEELSPYLNLANLAMKVKQFQEALKHCEAAKRADPLSPRPFLKKGFLYLSQTMNDEAEMEFRSAIALDPEYAMAHVNLGLVHYLKSRDSDAEAEFRKAIGIDNDVLATAYALNNLGNLRRRKGQTREALTLYLDALKISDGYAIAAMNAADMYLELGQRNQAVRYYEEALRLDPMLDAAQRKLDHAKKRN